MTSENTVTTAPKYRGKEIRSRTPVDPLAEETSDAVRLEHTQVMQSGPRFGGGGVGYGLGLGTGLLLGGALLGLATYRPYGYSGTYYVAPSVDPYYPYVVSRRDVKRDQEDEERRKRMAERHRYMMEHLRASHDSRLRELREESNSEARSNARHARNAKGEFSGARTRQAALRDEVMSSLDQDTYHRLYWSMKPNDREAVQKLLRHYMSEAELQGRIDDPIESNRLIENGLLPFVDYFTGERGIMPSDAMIYRGRLVSRRGFMMWLEEHRRDDMPPMMFDNAELERGDLAHRLRVHPEEYKFFRRRGGSNDDDDDDTSF